MWLKIMLQFIFQRFYTDLTPYYMMIIIGSLGFAAVFFYILYHVIRFIIQYKKKTKEANYKEQKN